MSDEPTSGEYEALGLVPISIQSTVAGRLTMSKGRAVRYQKQHRLEHLHE